MEHLEGETLAARLAKGALALDQALTIAVDITSALDAAHRAGFVHRDLKPGNIFLTKNGAKLLDFGLAKSSSPVQGFRPATSDAARPGATFAATGLPTTPPAAAITAQGTILGTFQYMAPEQLEGHDADSRSDIFAFGCVLFEMVTGRKAFLGKTQISLIGAILKDDPPPVSTVQVMTPAALDFVVRKSLAKDPDRRWQTASDLVSQLEWIAQGGGGVAAPGPAKAGHYVLTATAAVVLAAVTGGAAWFLKPAPSASPRPVTRFAVTLPSGQSFTRAGRPLLAISPDGTKLVYVANQRLYLRTMDQVEPAPIRGTDVDPSNPFFSPDGQWVGFYAANQLRKVAISGGAAVKLSDATNPYGASWMGDRIVFGQGVDGILEVSANGGAPKVIVKVDAAKNELAHGPELLPGGDAVLFTLATAGQWAEARAVAQSLKTGERKVLAEGATDARYVETGHLVYEHDATILAVPFDVERLQTKGGPVSVVEGVAEALGGVTGAAQFTMSRTGSLAFVAGSTAANRTLVWVDRRGVETPTSSPGRPFGAARVSPDGTRAAMEILDQEQAIWLLDFMRGTLTRLTFGRGVDVQPHWTPDGRRVLYSSAIEGDRGVYWKAADGTGSAERLTRGADAQRPSSVSADGKLLVVGGTGGPTRDDMNVVSLQGEHRTRPLLKTQFDEGFGEISPDGRWLAYQSNESGSNEIYVRPFPDVDKGRWQVSTSGGVLPRWSRDGRELFYTDRTSFVAVPVRADGSTFAYGQPVKLFPVTSYNGLGSGYDVAPDGRFLMVKVSTSNERQEITVVENWFEELKARVPSK